MSCSARAGIVPLAFACAASAAATPLVERVAWAQSTVEPTPAVTVTGDCPDPAAVQRVVATLFPPHASSSPVVAASVVDLGDRYRVSVAGRTKTYIDRRRDCAERARVAAAFVALALFPPDEASPEWRVGGASDGNPIAGPDARTTVGAEGRTGGGAAESGPAEARPEAANPLPGASAPTSRVVAPPASPEAPSPYVPTVAAARPARDGWLRIDVRDALGVGASPSIVSPGVLVEAAAGWRSVGARAACAWLFGTPLTLGGTSGDVLVTRFPCAVGPTLRFFDPSNRLELDVDAGLALGALVANGRGFATTYDATRFEWGVRGGFEIALHVGSHFAPVLGFEATYDYESYGLEVASQGVVAHTPRVWLGVTAGARWSSP